MILRFVWRVATPGVCFRVHNRIVFILVTCQISVTYVNFVFSGELPFERYHTLLQHNVIKDEPELEESFQEVTIGPEEEEQEEDDDDYDDEDETEEDAVSPMKDKPKNKVGRKRGVNFLHINLVTILE